MSTIRNWVELLSNETVCNCREFCTCQETAALLERICEKPGFANLSSDFLNGLKWTQLEEFCQGIVN